MADTPKRLQRKRTRGWRMPASAIYVGRPSRWGNHVRIDPAEIEGMTPAEARRFAHRDAVIGFEKSIMWNDEGDAYREAARRELRGHDLCCWCRLDEPCHADVLLRIANE